VLVATAAAVLMTAVAGTTRSSRPAPAPVTLVGLVADRTEAVTLKPGAARAWPAGRGVQAVVAISGQVAVYGPAGERKVYGPNRGFAAGWETYWTANETDAPAELLVTFQTRP